MDRSNLDRDNVSQRSQGGRTLHTYTPRSHEDLLKSHLGLTAARKARLQNELQRLTAENARLLKELDNANQQLQKKDEQIFALSSELRNKPLQPRDEQPDSYPNTVFEVDGKQLTLDNLLHHFSCVMQRHHDLINEKNQLIQQLQDALNNQQIQPVSPRTQAGSCQKCQDNEVLQQNIMNEFSKQLSLIRKEYDQVENILTTRNNTLEKLIEDLQEKLDQYYTEIQHLRNELAAREGTQQPSESTVKLIMDKEKENDYLKQLLLNYDNQKTTFENGQVPNENLKNEIRKVIESKNNAINKFNNLINEIKQEKTDELEIENIPKKPVLPEVEKECQAMLSDINNMNDKLNNLLQKLKESHHPAQEETIDKESLIVNLENLKKQCQDEIEVLKNQIDAFVEKSAQDAVILRGHAVVKIDDPDYLRKMPILSPEDQKEPPEQGVPPQQPIETSSNIKFMLYTTQPQYIQPRIKQTDEITFRPITEPSIQQSFKQTSEKMKKPKHYPIVPCEACSDANIYPEKSVTFVQQPSYFKRTPSSQEKELKPSKIKLQSPPSKKRVIKDFFANRDRSKERRKRSKSRGGCCGKKGSDSSNVPYTKYHEEEKLLNVHSSNLFSESSQHRNIAIMKDNFPHEYTSVSGQVLKSHRHNMPTNFK